MTKIKLVLILWTLGVCYSCREVVEGNYLISNVNIIDLHNGEILRNQYVLIKGEFIDSVYTTPIQIANSDSIIDGTNKFLIPGLWDMHAHYSLNYPYATALLNQYGITGIREMWGIPKTIDWIRKKQDSLNAPEIYSSGNIIDGVPKTFPWSTGVSTKQEAMDAVMAQSAEDVDFIKIYSRLNKSAYQGVAIGAKKVGLDFAGHLPNEVSLASALKYNQKSIEHLNGILEASIRISLDSLNKKGGNERKRLLLENFDPEKLDSVLLKIGNSSTWICPTLMVLRNTSISAQSIPIDSAALSKMPEEVLTNWEQRNTKSFGNESSAFSDFDSLLLETYKLQKLIVSKLEKNKVKFMAGTDFPNPYCIPGIGLHEELELLVENGVSPLGALQSATVNAVKFIDREKLYGQVKTGYTASLILLNSNPLERISNTRDIHSVFLRGTIVKKPNSPIH